MKKIEKFLLAVTMSMVFFSGCGNSSEPKKMDDTTHDKLKDLSKTTLKSIKILQDTIKIKEQENLKLTLQSKLSDGTTKNLTQDVTWTIEDSSILTIDKDGNLKALKSGQTFIQAKYGSKLSKKVKVTIAKVDKKAEVINGYTLPPEPDKTTNNATLLGVDSNDNGVRDDVERLIITKYKDNHKAVTKIGFQLARAYQKILDNPLNTDENHKALHNAMDCNFYYESRSQYFNEPILVTHYIDDTFKNLQLNTKLRVKAYLLYDKQLSGNVYRLAKAREMKKHCSQEVLDLVGGEK